ncbi:GlcG/HbpS family heme-binding protein [Sphingomonas sp.]|jgi:uncharacterized protein GlcG (DUF336 family)|uniref:GlcG/HbpS family heme-binding protein n=1 Tax=Sphingomonas sp. TaxID=28214 RepID=UPI002EDAF025
MLTLETASLIAQATLREGGERGLAPLCAVVLDTGGHDLVVMRSEHAASYRVAIARAKAAGCIGMGMGGREIARRAQAAPAFYASLPAIVSGGILPVPGGILIRGADGAVTGAVGVSGDTADNDEAAALAGVSAAGFAADTGAEP